MLQSTKLSELDLSDNAIKNDGIEILGNCINSNVLNSLKKLNLTNCKLDFTGVYKFFYDLQNNKRLEVLNLSKNNLCSDKFDQLKPILYVISLKELHLAKCRIGNSGGKLNTTILLTIIIFNKFSFYNC